MLSELRILLFSLFLLCSTQAKCQIFSFEDTSAVLVKTTNQSPAHWYLEIINEIGVDSTLRWKTHFQDVPSQWNISFDSQNQNWSMIVDGDSSDFVMSVNPDFPQKLIIGAMLNNTPGHGFVFFDIFDPENRTEVQTISYEFIISPATSGVDEIQDIPFLQFSGNNVEITNDKETTIIAYTSSGQKLFEKTSTTGFLLSEISSGPVFLHIQQENKTYVIRTLIP